MKSNNIPGTVQEMEGRFSISQSLILFIVVLNIMAVSVIPGYTESINYVLQIFIFLIVLILGIDLSKRFSLTGGNFNMIWILGVVIISSFLISAFYYNSTNSFKLLSLAKLLTFPIIIYFFFFYFPGLFYSLGRLFEKSMNYWLYVSIFSIIVALVFWMIGLNQSESSSGLTRGFFYYSNIFAFVFTFTIPILIYKYFTRQMPVAVFAILIAVSSVCLLLTFSRAAYIGVLAAILVMVYKKSKWLFVCVSLFLAIVSSSFIFGFASAKGSMSALTRLQVMYTGFNMITNYGAAKFLWGYGVTDSRAVFIDELTSMFQIDREEIGPHNFILTLGIQFGMVLTIAVLTLIIILLIKTAFMKINESEYLFYRVNLSISIIIGVLLQSVFEDIVIFPEFYVMPIFLVFLGYLNVVSKNRKLPE